MSNVNNKLGEITIFTKDTMTKLNGIMSIVNQVKADEEIAIDHVIFLDLAEMVLHDIIEQANQLIN